MPWLTGDTIAAADFICRRLVIPNDIALIMAVNGALLDLVKPRNWEQHGAATPDETAALMQTMFFDYQESECAEMTKLTINAGVFKYGVAQGQKQPQPNDGEWWPLSNVAVVWNSVATGLDGSGGIWLPAGTYLMSGMHTIFEAEECRLSWWNKSTNVMIVNGLSMNNRTSDDGQAVVHVMSIFQSAEEELFDMRVWVNRTSSIVLGNPADLAGMPEVYGLVNIIKLNYDL